MDRIENRESLPLAEAGENANGMRTDAWSYIRLSTVEQLAEGKDGEARQLDAAAAYAKTHDLDLQPPLKDLGVSAFKGKHRKSGKLKLFLSMVEFGLVPPNSFLLVENCDRLSREEPIIALETFTAIINAGINVVTTDDSQLGVRDDGGELRARDADLWHRDRPFRRRLIRADGLSLEHAAMRAWEAGFFPDIPVPAWDCPTT